MKDKVGFEGIQSKNSCIWSVCGYSFLLKKPL